MVAAKVRHLLKNRSSIPESAKLAGISQQYLGFAAIVLQFAPALADSVIAGTMALNDAYAKAKAAKEEAQSDEAKLLKLQKEAPDLAEQVTGDKLNLGEAYGAFDARKRAEAEAKRVRDEEKACTMRMVSQSLMCFGTGSTPESIAKDIMDDWVPELLNQSLSESMMEKAASAVALTVKLYKDKYGNK